MTWLPSPATVTRTSHGTWLSISMGSDISTVSEPPSATVSLEDTAGSAGRLAQVLEGGGSSAVPIAFATVAHFSRWPNCGSRESHLSLRADATSSGASTRRHACPSREPQHDNADGDGGAGDGSAH